MRERILIAGLGKTGLSVAHYLKRKGQFFSMFDTRASLSPDLLAEFHALFPDVDVFLGDLPADVYAQCTTVIASPGVALDHPVLAKLKHMQRPIFGDVDYFAREVSAPVIAITGTNGKSTVTTLVGDMAKAAGLSVAVAGNIGEPVLNLLADQQQYELWVLELSSFQLDLIEHLQPLAATILNISPDHLDRHHTFAAYVQAKQRIYRGAQQIIYNRDDEQTMPQARSVPVLISSYGLDAPSESTWGLVEADGTTYLACGQQRLLDVRALRIKGRHNWLNALAACALATAAGIPQTAMVDVLKTFSGLPHRSQWVRTLDGVDWINDSKGTNIGATISAITGIGSALTGKIVLIAGGQGKGADFRELCPAAQQYVRAAILIGEDAMQLDDALRAQLEITRHAASLHEAILLAQAEARPGDVVLLSPACASLDMFRDFNDRGEQFSAAVRAL